MFNMQWIEDDGKVLKGFSQVDLDELNKNIKRLGYMLFIFIVWIMVTFSAVIYWVKKYHIVTIILNALQ